LALKLINNSMQEKLEVIQQWQFIGPCNPELLKDEAFELAKDIGITSLQSYVTWAEIEKEKGCFDFSSYDPLVEKIKKHNLKWVPFLILGPEYATPKWFQDSKDSLFFSCLEHKKESKIQSIWNPNLPQYIDRFLKAFSQHYKDNNLFESLTLGVSGNWGEAIFPAEGGFNKGFHTHLGYWAGDVFARKSFVSYIKSCYPDVKNLRSSWGTDFSKIDFPALEKTGQSKLSKTAELLKRLPLPLKNILKFLKDGFFKLKKENFFLLAQPDFKPSGLDRPFTLQRWQDFIEWYFNSMNEYVELWLKTARNYFPHNNLYLVTGGIGEPASGADFSLQAKIAAKYRAGLRVTNQTNNYSQSFILTRLAASACRFYNTYFTTEEEAILQSGPGAVMRVFDAVSSGARGLYCKNFISTGPDDPCIKKHLEPGALTEAGRALKENAEYLFCAQPMVETVLFFPADKIVFDSDLLQDFYNKAAYLREFLDFDVIDKNMILDSALKKYKLLILISDSSINSINQPQLASWKESGGRVVGYQAALKENNRQKGVFSTKLEDGMIYYNLKNNKIKRDNKFKNKSVEIGPGSILAKNI